MTRIVIFWDYNFNSHAGSVLQVSQILRSTRSAGTTYNVVTSDLSIDQSDRIVILRDIITYLPPLQAGGATFAVGFPAQSIDLCGAGEIDLRGFQSCYEGDVGLLSEIQSGGALHAFVVCDVQGAGLAGWACELSMRIGFTDK